MKKRSLSVFLAFLMIIGTILCAVPASADDTAVTFSDVKETRWSYSSIAYAVEMGYMKGTATDKFSPADSLTRAMVVTVLFRREGSPAEYD